MRLAARVFAAVFVATATAPAQEQPVFPSAAQLVTIDAVVVDRDGRPVRGLTREDFQVTDGGEPQAITHFEAVTVAPANGVAAPLETAPTTSSNETAPALAPRSFVVVYDDLHIAPLRAPAARAAVDSFLEREVREGERVAIVVVGSGAWWTATIPEGREDLSAFLAGQSAAARRAWTRR